MRTNKAMGLHNLPSKSCDVKCGWMLAANLATDLGAWVRLLGLHDVGDLVDAEIDTMRFRLYHLPARLRKHARRRWLRIDATWTRGDAFTTCCQRWSISCSLPLAETLHYQRSRMCELGILFPLDKVFQHRAELWPVGVSHGPDCGLTDPRFWIPGSAFNAIF
ncbi:hypothetical protein AB0C64_44375, partial [Streptomyces sp900116325]